METIWHRPRWIRPLLGLLTWWAILFPETGNDVPAEMLVTAGRDRHGRPCQVWQRSFAFEQRQRHFNAVKVYDARRRAVVERLGPGGMIQIPWHVQVRPSGGLTITIAGIWLGPLRVPEAISADVIATEEALDPRTIRIDLTVSHRLLGPVFGYEGRFEVRVEPLV